MPDTPVPSAVTEGRRIQPIVTEPRRIQPIPDAVDHPPHYNDHPSGVECIDVVEHMNFNRGNAIKYIWRAGSKGDEIEDLRKARWYVDREIQRLAGESR